MILRLTNAGRRRALWVWMMAIAIAIAPALSMSFGTPAGAFSDVVVHAHEGGQHDHSHHTHGHGHNHDHGAAGPHDEPVPDGDGGPAYPSKGNLHVHHDASCPSVLMPAPIADLAEPSPDKAFDRPLLHSLSGASPDTLLRPPISHLHI